MRDSRTLNGELDDHSWRQAVDGFKQGGLSWRTVLDLALPPFLASRVTSRPPVEALLSSVAEAGMADLEMLLENSWHGQRCRERGNRETYCV